VTLAYVSGGSNLDAEHHLVQAARLLVAGCPGTRFSRCYRNRAIGFEGPDFINFVAEMTVQGTPEQLKRQLERIEAQCGRERGAPRWAPRSMDLDILLFGDLVQDTPGLVLPRPDLLRWGFMLGPLAELAPQRLHPVVRRPLGELWQVFDQTANPLFAVALDLNAA